jgi:hypothetical protein
MINLNFGLWWSGSKLSYLRYLTFKSLRYFHPHSRIQLYTSKKYKNDGHIDVRQEFNSHVSIDKDYIGELANLNIEIITTDKFDQYYPNHQSDYFRWWYLNEFGGFYLDTDQIILRPFVKLPLKKYNFIYSSYKVDSPFVFNGKFSPVGVLGSIRGSVFCKYMSSEMKKYYDASNYNSIGPLMFQDILSKIKIQKSFNAPSNYFYPAPICNYINKFYKGKIKMPKESFALHWFGGYENSQKFNVKFDEKFAKKSNDSISVFLRGKRIL